MRGFLVLLSLLISMEIACAMKISKPSWLIHTRQRRDATICHITREEYDKMVETTEKDGVKSRKIRIERFLELLHDADINDHLVKYEQLKQLARKLILRQGATTDNAPYKLYFKGQTGVNPDTNAGGTHIKGPAAVGEALAERFEHPYRVGSVVGEPGRSHTSFASPRFAGNRPYILETFRSSYQPDKQHIQGTYNDKVVSNLDVKRSSSQFEHLKRIMSDAATHSNPDFHTKFTHPEYSHPSNIPHVSDYAHSIPRAKISVSSPFRPLTFAGGRLGK